MDFENNSIYDKKEEPVNYIESEKQIEKKYPRVYNVEKPIDRQLGYNKTNISDNLETMLYLEL